jgi:subtilisin family serine protease
MLIAVLDDGFKHVNTNPGFDSLYSSGRILDKYNFVLADTGVYAAHVHGTEVLSTMAGYVPNTYVGAAPLAQYALYVTEEQGPEHPIEMDNMIAGMERADSVGADILSTSLGYDVFFSPVPYSIPDQDFNGHTTPVAIAANHAVAKGMLLVITAGNEGPAGLLTPGDADSVITVGSVDINKNSPANSGYGPNTDGQVKPDVCAMGAPGSVLISTLTPTSINGTSIATPQIAGFAACLWQGSPTRSNYEIKRAIIESSHLFTNPTHVQLGYGVPDFCAALKALDIDETRPNQSSITIYPNPFSDELTISLTSSRANTLLFELADVTGKLVFRNTKSVDSGKNLVKIDTPVDLATGVYLCRMILDNEVKTVKLIKN